MLIILPSSLSQTEEGKHSPTDVNDVSNLSHKLGCWHSIYTEKKVWKTIWNVYISIAADLIHISAREAAEE